jgi:hypothetical protein
MIDAFADPERGGFFSTAATASAARAPQGPRGHADPQRLVERGAGACCAWPR